jgi:hypothetical protein
MVDDVEKGIWKDWKEWNKKEYVKNEKEEMGMEDDWLNVRKLIKKEEMVKKKMDEM